MLFVKHEAEHMPNIFEKWEELLKVINQKLCLLVVN
jgi:hypothetical protein